MRSNSTQSAKGLRPLACLAPHISNRSQWLPHSLPHGNVLAGFPNVYCFRQAKCGQSMPDGLPPLSVLADFPNVQAIFAPFLFLCRNVQSVREKLTVCGEAREKWAVSGLAREKWAVR